MLGLENILNEDKLARLEAMANQMDGVSDKMLEAAQLADRAADKMLEAQKESNG